MPELKPSRLQAGVVGAGVFATFHARKYVELTGVELVGVYDPHLERAQTLAGEVGAKPYAELQALLDACHVVTVASPASSHAEVAGRALASGRHVYVEKPLARTVEDAAALVEQADARRLVLAAGHQERVTFAAMGLLDTRERARRLQSVRRGPPAPRSRDVSCVLDLMVHDLDLALQLGGGDVSSVQARGDFDQVRAEIAFRGGLHAVLEASRIAETRERTMGIDYPSGRVEVDFLAPSFRNGAAFTLNADFAASSGGRDPLGASVAGFVDAVQGRRERPVATGGEGLAAVGLALRVERAARL